MTSSPLLSPSSAQLTAWGLDPQWSRRVSIPGADGRAINWHIFDTGPGAKGTIVCVHGNPTWGYLWRDLMTTLSPDWRVIAVDQTGMGFSERGRPRILAQRIAELVNFCQQEVTGPLILAAHDWGGPVAVGAASALDVAGLILANTAVAKPPDVRVPPLIATARRLVDLTCRRTALFVEGTARMTRPSHRSALRAPYKTASRREAVRDFVADIPLTPNDASYATLETTAETFSSLTCPILLLWGGKDPVFHDRFLRDLRQRAPHAQVQRFSQSGHLVLLDEASGAVIRDWLGSAPPDLPKGSGGPVRSVLTGVRERTADTSAVYSGPDGTLRWSELAHRSALAASALRSDGLAKGDRVSLLIPPSPELLVAACAVWRCGGVPVVADASAGLGHLRDLVRAAAPRYVIGTRATLMAARSLRFAPGARAAMFGSFPGVLNLAHGSDDVSGGDVTLAADDVAAIVHTSGATGPAKAVRYTHGQLAAQRAVTAPMFDLAPGDSFTTSFAAFMLLSPLLEMACVRPAFDLKKPSTLDFDTLAAALGQTPVSTAWLSPASAKKVNATAKGRTLAIPLVMLAGAPVSDSVLHDMARITESDVRTPYGMTECLPVTDGRRRNRKGLHGGLGVGSPLPGCEVRIGSLEAQGQEFVAAAEWGEILVSAPWLFDGYEEAADVDLHANVYVGTQRFHRTGDVGYLEDGELFILGRTVHVISTAQGPRASVAIEEVVAASIGRDVAAVGVGPKGAQVVALVLADEGALRLAPLDLRTQARAHLELPVAAVLEGKLPTDHRHESKIDRQALARSVTAFLAGR